MAENRKELIKCSRQLLKLIMANWNLAEKQIYKLLKHPFQKEKSDIESITAAYLEFVEELFDYLNKENDNKTRIRQLNMSYIDFGTIKALEETSPTENSKLKIIYLDKLLSLINMEQELIYRQMEYPKFFINIESDWKSPFYLNSEVIGDIYKKEIAVIKRKPTKITDFLGRLKLAIIKKSKDNGYDYF